MSAGNPDHDGPIIKLDKVSRLFPGPPQVFAMKEAELTVNRGEYIAIIGPSGSGKSTLLNTLGLLDRPSAGDYYFEGIATGQLSEDERAAIRSQAIGFVFQSFHLLATRTVLENVMLAGTYSGVPRVTREEQARAALLQVGLGHRLDFYPPKLSGGERQRVAIARAICAGPRLLLADEPTGNLDRKNSEIIMELFAKLAESGLTIIMITHDDHVAAAAQRRVRIVDGTLQELDA